MQVGDAARDRTGYRAELSANVTVGTGQVERGYASETGAYALQTAGISRITHRAGDVSAMPDRAYACGGSSGSTAGRASGGQRRVARVERMAMQRIARKPAHRKCRGIGSANDDRAGGAQVGYYRTVGVCDQVLLYAQAVGAGMPLLIDIHLDGYRYTGEQPRILSGGNLLIDHRGSSQRLLRHLRYHRVNLRVDVLQALQRLRGDFDR